MKLLEFQKIVDTREIIENLNSGTYLITGERCMFSHLGLEGLEGLLTTKSMKSTLCGANKDERFKFDAISQRLGRLGL